MPSLVLPFGVPGMLAQLDLWGYNQLVTVCAFWGGLYLLDGVSGQRGHSTLRREAATRADSGTYACRAENSAGAIRATAFVSVRGR